MSITNISTTTNIREQYTDEACKLCVSFLTIFLDILVIDVTTLNTNRIDEFTY